MSRGALLTVAFVAAGSNLAGPKGSPADAVRAAFRTLEDEQIQVVKQSRLYASTAWPDPAYPAFVNAVARIETVLAPSALLARLHEIEADFGRVRRQTNAPRTLDLDILDYGGVVSAPGETPVLPHPRLEGRAFVLLPLAELDPAWRHPVTGKAIAELVAALPDRAAAWLLDR